MDNASGVDDEFYRGLHELAETTFPKRCAACGRVYRDAREFALATRDVGRTRGFKSATDDDGKPTLELFRNCVCGSTLLGVFDERRDVSETGVKRRARFAQLIAFLAAKGLPAEVARGELIKVLRGGQSTVLAPYLHG